MFKKTLLALALTGLTGTATAAEIKGTPTSYSAEGIEFLSSVSLEPVIVVLESVVTATDADGDATGYYTYKADDKLVFTFPNDKLAVGIDASLSKVKADGKLDDPIAGLKPTYTANTITFTLADDTAGLTNDTKIGLSGVLLDSANLNAGGKVKVDYTAKSGLNSSAFDGADEVVVATARNQFDIKATTTLLDAKVDVSEDRLVFVGGAMDDTFNVELVNEADKNKVTVDKVVYTLSGDFSFLDTDADGEIDYNISGFPGTRKIAEDFQSIVYTHESDLTANVGLPVKIEATDGTTKIPTSEFTLATELTYTAGGKERVKNYSFSVGEWVLNGYESKASFLPFGSQYAQSVTVTNAGTVDGAITIELTAGGKTESKVITEVSMANTVTDISSSVKEFAAELGLNGNAALNVIVDAPSANIVADVIYFAKADKDRVKTK